MKDAFSTQFVPILLEFAFLAGFALLLVSLVVGLLLVLRPQLVIDLNRRVDRRFSLRRAFRPLELPRYIDRSFYRHHRIIGLLVTAASAYVLYYFLRVYDAQLVSATYTGSQYSALFDVLVTSVSIFVLVAAVFTLVIGVFVLVRPSLLKDFEAWSNRWISTRRAMRPLERNNDDLNELAYQHPRLTGIIIIFISLYAAYGLFMVYI